jgi:2-keto-4-pentenoate hydratase
MDWNTMTPDEAAALLLRHRDEARALPVPPPALRLASLPRGYAAQDALDGLLRGRGQRVVGWKIAGTNAAARAHLRIDAPFMGRLHDATSAPSGAVLPARPGFFRVHEPEIALLIGRDLTPADAPFDAAAVEAATAAVLPAIELIGTWFDPWAEAGAPALAADNAAHGFWVHGAPVRDWSGIDLLDGPVVLRVDGEERARGAGRNVDGGPFAATAWLANALAAEGRALRAGDQVTTGTVTPPVPVLPGQRVEADFGPLGRVALTMAPG